MVSIFLPGEFHFLPILGKEAADTAARKKRAILPILLVLLVCLGGCVSRSSLPAEVTPAPTETTVPAQTASPAHTPMPTHMPVPADTPAPEEAPADLPEDEEPFFGLVGYSAKRINDAYIYRCPGSRSVVVWLTGGHGSKPILDQGLCQRIYEGELAPNCTVLCPWVRNDFVTAADMRGLLEAACPEAEHLSIVGWSLGSDKVAELVLEDPELFERAVLLSNYHQQWDKTPERLRTEIRFLTGSTEPGGSSYLPWRILGLYEKSALYRVEPYKHFIGRDIWDDPRFAVLEWLAGETDDIYVGDPSLLEQESERRWLVHPLTGEIPDE